LRSWRRSIQASKDTSNRMTFSKIAIIFTAALGALAGGKHGYGGKGKNVGKSYGGGGFSSSSSGWGQGSSSSSSSGWGEGNLHGGGGKHGGKHSFKPHKLPHLPKFGGKHGGKGKHGKHGGKHGGKNTYVEDSPRVIVQQQFVPVPYIQKEYVPVQAAPQYVPVPEYSSSMANLPFQQQSTYVQPQYVPMQSASTMANLPFQSATAYAPYQSQASTGNYMPLQPASTGTANYVDSYAPYQSQASTGNYMPLTSGASSQSFASY